MKTNIIKKALEIKGFNFCDREGIQTPNLLIRSETLYSVELRSLLYCVISAKIKKNIYI